MSTLVALTEEQSSIGHFAEGLKSFEIRSLPSEVRSIPKIDLPQIARFPKVEFPKFELPTFDELTCARKAVFESLQHVGRDAIRNARSVADKLYRRTNGEALAKIFGSLHEGDETAKPKRIGFLMPHETVES